VDTEGKTNTSGAEVEHYRCWSISFATAAGAKTSRSARGGGGTCLCMESELMAACANI